VKVRHEPWGAWVRTEDPPALVALDHATMRSLGLESGVPAFENAPLEVHLAVTSKCSVGCEGCYLDATPAGAHVPLEDLYRRIDEVAKLGVFTIALGGGEPILRDDLDRIASYARAKELTCVLTTSGIGLTEERARSLRGFAQVNVSYDGTDTTYEAVRGVRGANHAERAIEMLVREGIRVGVNVVLTRTSFDDLEPTLDRAKLRGAIEAQLLRYKPAGRAARLDYLDKRLTLDQARSLTRVLRAYVARDDRMRVRIDCALVPFLSADPEIDARRVALLGIFGCEAGAALAAIRSDGRVAPCSFAAPGSTSIVGDPWLARFRDHAKVAPEPCASCPLRRACRGGCKVITNFLQPETGGFAPDPECPRVRAHRSLKAR
jgi:radical SAM protein with 4Fe4S-binding SPASM domain